MGEIAIARNKRDRGGRKAVADAGIRGQKAWLKKHSSTKSLRSGADSHYAF